MPTAAALSVAEILRLASAEGDSSVDWGEHLQGLATQALGELLAAREREGARLATMLLGHLAQLRTWPNRPSP